MLPTFIYHKKHVINLYISDEVLSTWGFQMWHIINLYISKTLIYTFKRSNNISEGTYQLQGSKCDTLSIHTSMLSMCKPLINLCILEATCHAFIYLFIYGSVIVQASLTVRALAAPLFPFLYEACMTATLLTVQFYITEEWVSLILVVLYVTSTFCSTCKYIVV